MRCPDCNKFVSQELQEPEVQNIDIDESGNVTAEVRIVLACAGCGTELKDANLSMEQDFSKELEKHINVDGCREHSLSIEEDGCEGVEDVNKIDRKGKPIKNPRYMATLYGARVDFSIHCECEDAKVFSGFMEEKVRSSEMDELA